MAIDVSIIIVNYNTKQLLDNCLETIFLHTKDVSFEVIISDNGSVDGSIEMVQLKYPNVILIENNQNLGFGRANNRAAKIAKGKYILYLNSDTELKNNAIKFFFNFWETSTNPEQIGALGANLLDSSGNYMHSFASLPRNQKLIFEPIKFFATATIKSFFLYIIKRNPKFLSRKHKFDKYVGEVGYITGADLFLKNNNEAFFDEDYFMYYEECDLEYKLAEKGLKRYIIDGPEIYHLENGSDKSKKGYSLSNIFNEISRIKYIRKNTNIKFFIPMIKLFVFLTWLNPFIFKKSKPYFKEYLTV